MPLGDGAERLGEQLARWRAGVAGLTLTTSRIGRALRSVVEELEASATSTRVAVHRIYAGGAHPLLDVSPWVDLIEAASFDAGSEEAGNTDGGARVADGADALVKDARWRALLDLLAAQEKQEATSGRGPVVAALTALMIRELGLPAIWRSATVRGALIHDIGRIGIPLSLLQRPGALSTKELAEVRRHAVLGDEIVSGTLSGTVERAIVRHHHEYFDGSGYPDGLVGAAIPLGARVVAVADAYVALRSDRPHRSEQDPSTALAVVKASSGQQFDPECVAVLEGVVREWESLVADAELFVLQRLLATGTAAANAHRVLDHAARGTPRVPRVVVIEGLTTSRAVDPLTERLAAFVSSRPLLLLIVLDRPIEGSASNSRHSIPARPPYGLTTRESEVLQLMASGATNREIAQKLRVSPFTVANHVKAILNKTGSMNRTEAAARVNVP